MSDDEQFEIRAGFAPWSEKPVARLDDIAAWFRDCAEKVEANAEAWRSVDQPPEIIMADYLRDRAQGIADYAFMIWLERDSGVGGVS